MLATLGGLGLTDQARGILIAQCWTKVVGPEIASRTEPDGFSRGTLRVRASTAAWQNELTFLKAQIRDKLNELLGSALVKDIRVVGGSLRPRTGAPRLPWLGENPTGADLDAASSCGIAIKDESVRRAFEKLMCLHLAASRHR